MNNSNRRDFLKKASGLALGLAAATGFGGSLACSKPGVTVTRENTAVNNVTTTVLAATNAVFPVPWVYHKLDTAVVAEKAYANFARGRCMYSAFDTIIGMLAAQYGAPYNTFPTSMMKYGAVGIVDWGTVCGALNGAAAAVYLLTESKTADQIINELFYWHSLTALPDYAPASSKFTNIPASVSDSPLCHLSITKWSKLSGFKTNSQERVERCVRLTASVTRKTVELLNQNADGAFKAVYKLPDDTGACLACHGPGSAEGDVHIYNQTDCSSCHTALSPIHTAVPK